MPAFTIPTPKGERMIGYGQPCFVVAEMSGNHNQNYDTAVAIVKAAAAAGADAIKLQTFKPETHTLDSHKPWFMERSSANPDSWKGKSFYELYQKVYTPWEWHAPLQTLAHELGLVFFSAPGSAAAVDFLEGLRVPCHKVASYEATDVLLLKKLAATHKPIIMSVGFATREEIEYSLAVLRDHGAGAILLLHCTTAYAGEPALEHANLRTMIDIRDRYDVAVGFSDNNGGIAIPVTAVAMGASMIEKHFIIDGQDGVDARFSLEPSAFQSMVEAIRRTEKIMGAIQYGPQSEIEADNLRYRRSLFVVKDMKQGEVFTPETVQSIRPADGLPVRFYDQIIGRHASRDIERGTPLTWELIAESERPTL